MTITQNGSSKLINEDNRHLLQMGWTSHFQTQLENICSEELMPTRVVGVRKNNFRISNGKNEWLATAAGRLKHRTDGIYPVVGDWVLSTGKVVYEVLTRKNTLSRGAAGTHGKHNEQPQKEQVIAANLDTVFVVCGLDRDFNLRRIERYLTLVYNCGLNPVIILTKADLHQNLENFVAETETIAYGVPVHPVATLDNKGLTHLEEYLAPGQTTTMLGSSGAGKSTLINQLYGKPVQATGSTSDSAGKGKHTTTARDLITMPQGGMVIDNPGLREIAFWDDGGGIGFAFAEIEHLAGKCRFSDCSHTHEPGCRVLQAVAEGEITSDRLESFRKMKRELDFLTQRRHKSADRIEKERWKEVALKVKAMKKKSRNG